MIPDATPSETYRSLVNDLAVLADAHYELTLFVNGASQRSAQAITNIRSLCDTHLAGRFHLEIVDVHENPELVNRHRILASPTLVKQEPLPVRMLVGDLSDPDRVLAALDVQATDQPERLL